MRVQTIIIIALKRASAALMAFPLKLFDVSWMLEVCCVMVYDEYVVSCFFIDAWSLTLFLSLSHSLFLWYFSLPFYLPYLRNNDSLPWKYKQNVLAQIMVLSSSFLIYFQKYLPGLCLQFKLAGSFFIKKLYWNGIFFYSLFLTFSSFSFRLHFFILCSSFSYRVSFILLYYK